MSLLDLLLCLSSLLWSLAEGADVRIVPTFTPSEKVFQVRGQNFFLPGASLTLTCVSDVPGAALNWTQTLQTSKWPHGPAHLVQSSGVSGSTKEFPSLSASNGGLYNCTDGHTVTSFYVNVWHADNVDARGAHSNGSPHKVTLRCEQRFGVLFPLTWTRTDETGHVEELNRYDNPDHNFTVLIRTDQEPHHLYELEIRGKGRYPLRTGPYECELDSGHPTVEKIRKTVFYNATPDVRIEGRDRSKVAIKGSFFSITCVYSGAFNGSTVQWAVNASRDPKSTQTIWQVLVPYNATLLPCSPPVEGHPDRLCLPAGNGSRYTLNRDRHLEAKSLQHELTSVLEIHNVTETDRGRYHCFAENEHGHNNQSTFVRAKDHWGALWPFLGVVAEVILLALIICICERRRSKMMDNQEEESKPLSTVKAEEERNTMPADNAGAVRNRK